ncbi:DDE family transposase [Kribbella steppae]|uniref:DDE family transposase n=1 Tax=Kribbella steppae TaxID=2512223 RepID=A0A4R2GWY1_9ACTN|nr:DDE family transposase [Kribbella steppae]
MRSRRAPFEVKTTGLYPCVRFDAAGSGVASQAGGLLLTARFGPVAWTRNRRRVLSPWRKPLARHDPAKIVTGLAIALGLGGDCPADIAAVRAEVGVLGSVASDPTVSCTIDALAGDVEVALKGDQCCPGSGGGLVGPARTGRRSRCRRPVDYRPRRQLGGCARRQAGRGANLKRGYGFHALCAFVDHGPDGPASHCGHVAARERRIEHGRRPHPWPRRPQQLPSHRRGPGPGAGC